MVWGSLERTDAYRNISTARKCLFQDEPIVFILKSVLSLRSFNHEFTRFEKKIIHGAILQIKTPRPLNYLFQLIVAGAGHNSMRLTKTDYDFNAHHPPFDFCSTSNFVSLWEYGGEQQHSILSAPLPVF